MTTKYGRSPWIDTFPRSRVPSYPGHRGNSSADVVIVGGGLTGCATAYALAANGVDVMLLEAGQIGRGATGSAAGWVSDDPGVPFAAIEKLHGVKAARRAWQAWRRAALDFGALVRRLGIRCDFESKPAALVAITPEQTAWLKRDLKERRGASLDAPALGARALAAEFGITAAAGLRLKDGATLDPYRAAVGLAASAHARGARLFERTVVRRITFDRKAADLHTATGRIHARRIVVATGAPTALHKALVRHFWYRASYAALTEPIPARIRRQIAARGSVLCDAADPPHVVRWVDDERLLITGAEQNAPPPRRRAGAIVPRTGRLMYELSLFYPEISGLRPEYGWDLIGARSADGLPSVGPHRNFPHQIFAWGGSSPTLSYMASRMILRHVLDEKDPADDVFGFNR